MSKIYLQYDRMSYHVKILKSDLSANDIRYLLDYTWVNEGRFMTDHFVGYLFFKQSNPNIQFVEPKDLIDEISEYSNYVRVYEKLKSMDEYENVYERILKSPMLTKYISHIKTQDGFSLRKNQLTGALYLFLTKSALLADSLGLGKTTTAFASYQIIKGENPDKRMRMIYVTKTDLIENVYEDITNSMPHLKLLIWNNNKKNESIITNYDWDVLIVNLDKFRTRFEKFHSIFDYLTYKGEFGTLIVDECTSLKCNWDGSMSKMTTNFMKLVNFYYTKIQMRIGISGTPIKNSISDIYNLMRFIDKSLLGLNYEWFISNFCRLSYRKVKIYGKNITKVNGISGSKNENVLKTLIRHKMIRRNHSDVPEFESTIIPVNLTIDEKKAYNNIIDKYNKENPNSENNTPLIMSLIKFLNSTKSKLEMLKYVLEQSENKDIVFTKYIENGQYPVRDMLAEWNNENHSFMYVNGSNKHKWKKSTDIGREFEEKRRICLATDCLQHGHNFQFANRVIHYELPYTYDTFDQRNGRVRRIGQKNQIYWILLYVKGSIEEYIYKKLFQKGKLLNSFTDNIYVDEAGNINISTIKIKKFNLKEKNC